MGIEPLRCRDMAALPDGYLDAIPGSQHGEWMTNDRIAVEMPVQFGQQGSERRRMFDAQREVSGQRFVELHPIDPGQHWADAPVVALSGGVIIGNGTVDLMGERNAFGQERVAGLDEIVVDAGADVGVIGGGGCIYRGDGRFTQCNRVGALVEQVTAQTGAGTRQTSNDDVRHGERQVAADGPE